MFCTACGTKNALDANFCKQCGQKIDRTAPPSISEEDFAMPASAEDRVSDLLVRAFQKYEAGDLDGAISACSEALALRPDSTSAHSLLGMLYERQGEREKAIAEYEKVLQLNPGSIADREKLDILRDGTIRLAPRKITSSHRSASPVLFDSPASAAVVALAVFLLVLMVGAWAVWMNAGKARPVDAATSRSASLPATSPVTGTLPPNQGTGTMAPPQNFASAPQGQQGQPYAPSPWIYPPYPAPNYEEANRARPRAESARPDTSLLRPVPPASVAPPSTAPMERDASATRNEPDTTFHLPENPAPTPTDPAAAPSRDPGKIEIVVSPGASSNPSAGSGDAAGAAMDSRSRQMAAQQLQMQGNYQRAIKEYLKALDGAGDDTASIHQKIALCYQRLDDKESATTHYNDAIAAYKALISAGRNVEAANRGIKACEAALKALR